ncbi:MAG: alpha/beta fold hydrolase [Planctomycetes bacterium]|nr:alpha/beta fold hydrolase [Planctomycetota bacterium]
MSHAPAITLDTPRLGDRAGRAILGLFLHAPRYSFHKPFQPSLIRRARAMGAEYFTVVTPDGHRIDALHLPPAAGAPARLPVVFSHGYMEVKECRLGAATRLRQRGHGVILYDLRGHGRSARRHITFGARERHDLAALLDHAQARGLIADRVISMGLSLGGATALLHAAADKRVAGVVAYAPFADSGLAVNNYRRKYAPVFGRAFIERSFGLAARRAGFEVSETSAMESARLIDAPVLLIVGMRDTNLPADHHTKPILRASPAGRCTLLEVPGATHFNLMSRRWPGVDEKVAAFCDRVESR